MVAFGDAEEDEDAEEDKVADVEAVVVERDEEVLAPHLQTICKTRRGQEDVEEWHLQG